MTNYSQSKQNSIHIIHYNKQLLIYGKEDTVYRVIVIVFVVCISDLSRVLSITAPPER